MNNTIVKNLGPWQRVSLAALCIVPLIAWFGVLDAVSSSYLNASLASAGVIYGTARGINALVSVLQGTELDIVFVTAAVGEVLDPVNDLVERFSAVVLIALGSLALQKLLLGLVSHSLFNTLLTLLAIAAGYALLRKGHRSSTTLFRCFLIAVFLRFSLGLVVAANGWVDSAFLHSDDVDRHASMEGFRNELQQASALAGTSGPSDAQLEALKTRIDQLIATREDNRRSWTELSLELAQSESRLSTLISADGVACTALTVSRHTCSNSVLKARSEVSRKQQQHDTLALNNQSIQAQIDKLNNSLECMQKRSRGESCGFTERVSAALSPAQFREKMAQLDQNMDAFVENTIDLLMSLLLKSIVIPLAFFYLLLKVTRLNLAKLK